MDASLSEGGLDIAQRLREILSRSDFGRDWDFSRELSQVLAQIAYQT